MTTAAETLIAQGKTAVEAELSRIETALAAAKLKAEQDAGALASALGAKITAHANEVATAQALSARATSITGTAATAPTSSGPAITLSSSDFAKISQKIKALGWKGPAIVVVGLIVIHYVITHIL